MRSPHYRWKNQRGMALMLVIGVVSLLVAIVIGLRVASEASWDESTLSRMRFQAKMLAESGANLALHPDIQPGDPILVQDFGDGRGFRVRIRTEGGRIPVSALSTTAMIETTSELFTRWGLDATQAAIAAESLADWVDGDSEARSNGAEQAYYAGLDHPEYPTNEPLVSLETMLLVRGMDAVARIQPLWRDYFTLYGSGTIDLNSAPADLIEAVLDVDPDNAMNFISARAGGDGLLDTDDDEPITDTNEAQQLLGLTSDAWNEKSSIITLIGDIRRIESTGIVGDHQVTVVLLTEVNDDELTPPVARYTE